MIIVGGAIQRIFPLLAHLLKRFDPGVPETADENEEVSVVCTHNLFAGTDLVAAAGEMRALASGAKALRPYYTAAINPNCTDGKELTDDQAEAAAKLLLKNLGFSDDHQWFLVKHRKKGRVHYHVVANRVDPMTLKAIHLSHNYRKQELVSRELEVLYELPVTPGPRTCSPGQRPPTSRRNRKEEQQAKRTALPLKTVDADLAWAWSTSETGAEFLLQLDLRGYQLAKGDRRPWVVVDPAGGTHNPTRRLKIKAAELRAKTHDLAEIEFPRIKEFREELARIAAMPDSDHDIENSHYYPDTQHTRKIKP